MTRGRRAAGLRRSHAGGAGAGGRTGAGPMRRGKHGAGRATRRHRAGAGQDGPDGTRRPGGAGKAQAGGLVQWFGMRSWCTPASGMNCAQPGHGTPRRVYSRLSALGSRLSALGSRLSALGSRLSALGSRLSALGSRLSALGSRLSALGSQLSALSSQLSILSALAASCRIVCIGGVVRRSCATLDMPASRTAGHGPLALAGAASSLAPGPSPFGCAARHWPIAARRPGSVSANTALVCCDCFIGRLPRWEEPSAQAASAPTVADRRSIGLV